jgi:hypothetical protein
MIHIAQRLADLNGLAHGEGQSPVILILHFRENWHTGQGPWIAAICEDSMRMPLLDSLGEASLAAAGVTPQLALTALDTKLQGLP